MKRVVRAVPLDGVTAIRPPIGGALTVRDISAKDHTALEEAEETDSRKA